VRAGLGVRPEQLLVLFVGRIVRAKGVFELVDAVALARRQGRDLVCALVGAHAGFDDSVELCGRLRRTPELAPHVQVLPACAPEAVAPYLHAGDVFAFPSHREGMPNSLLEAMAAGLPALAYAIPPVLEIDHRLGALKLVPPQDVGELARALVELADSPELRRRFGAQGQARVMSRYRMQASMAEAVRRLHAFPHERATIESCSTGAPMFSPRPRNPA